VRSAEVAFFVFFSLSPKFTCAIRFCPISEAFLPLLALFSASSASRRERKSAPSTESRAERTELARCRCSARGSSSSSKLMLPCLGLFSNDNSCEATTAPIARPPSRASWRPPPAPYRSRPAACVAVAWAGRMCTACRWVEKRRRRRERHFLNERCRVVRVVPPLNCLSFFVFLSLSLPYFFLRFSSAPGSTTPGFLTSRACLWTGSS